MSDRVDVLIVGAGPTGLMVALWMAQLGIRTRFVDRRGTRVLNGHADGLQSRTLEILNSFGMLNSITDKSASFLEWCVWVPDKEGRLRRNRRQPAFGSAESRFASTTIHQGHIESALLEAIRNRSNIDVERGVEPVSLKVDQAHVDDPRAYPITVELQHLEKDATEISQTNAHRIEGGRTVPVQIDRSGNKDLVTKDDLRAGTKESVRVKYLLACEGAHSWIRRQLGFVMEGESKNEFWGVIDVVPVTDFLDIRKLCTIQSDVGTILIVPREKGLVRLYVQLAANNILDETPESARDAYTPASLFTAANKILAPYTISYSYCDWWTVFKVGRRVSSHYSSQERIFLAGDAVHSHTPKGGQGMNVSIQDAYNLGWKIGGVLKGQVSQTVLKSYEAERRPVAQELIALDHDLSNLLAGKPNEPELRRVYEHAGHFLPGTNVCYESPLTMAEEIKFFAKEGDMLVKNIRLGTRFPSYQVMHQASASIVETQGLLRSDGRWRLLVFGGDLSSRPQLECVNRCGETLANCILKEKSNGILSASSSLETSIQVILIHCTPRSVSADIELLDLHPTFFPFLNKERGYDYDRVYADVPSELPGSKLSGDVYGYYGIDPRKGCVVVTRPDQHVGFIGPLSEELAGLKSYLDGIFLW